MRCPKCNSRIDNTLEYCNYCGERVKSNQRDDQYEYSKAYSNIKEEYDTPHEEQYTYSKTYSDSQKEYDTPHEEQYNYSKTYSDSQKEYDTPHEEQYNYSKTYSDSQKEYNTPHEEQYAYSKTYSDSQKEYDTPHENQYVYSQQYSNSDSTIITSDNDYIKAYLSESTYKSINDPKIPLLIAPIFFGPFYLYYKKLWGAAIISTLILIVFSIMINNMGLTCFILNIILAKITGRLLSDKANKTVEKIKAKNPDKDSRELLELCKKSGTPLKIGYILFIAIVTFFLISFLSYMY